MRRLFKATVSTAGIVFAFLALAMTYSTQKGYTIWFAKIPEAVITADGKQIRGWLHSTRDGQVFFLTRADSEKPFTYNLSFAPSGNGMISGCGTWVAPRLPVIPIGDVDPPCWFRGGGSGGRNLARGLGSVSFVTSEGVRFEAHW